MFSSFSHGLVCKREWLNVVADTNRIVKIDSLDSLNNIILTLSASCRPIWQLGFLSSSAEYLQVLMRLRISGPKK